jgi:hypothetical protein
MKDEYFRAAWTEAEYEDAKEKVYAVVCHETVVIVAISCSCSNPYLRI